MAKGSGGVGKGGSVSGAKAASGLPVPPVVSALGADAVKAFNATAAIAKEGPSTLSAIMDKSGLSPKVFQGAMQKLYNSDSVVLHQHDSPGTMSANAVRGSFQSHGVTFHAAQIHPRVLRDTGGLPR